MDALRSLSDADLKDVGAYLDGLGPRFERVMRYLNLTHPADVIRLLLITADKAIAAREGEHYARKMGVN
uniref:Uncharacterized protein n=1 Tax=uncultured prokaryote TaxID=198431 RepID=H5SCM3_9ZZZZ|nr:hypothetical protein HGMM_F11C09C17 [uncultured prokaryote]